MSVRIYTIAVGGKGNLANIKTRMTENQKLLGSSRQFEIAMAL